eukprot:TRINITY_DN5099_c0_g1_i1.p1 TRINITY_DN5099_c0_g1~~TRINITY_DN5099_c0_g1_i1.p1  ORF type:complete len:106 (+),score=37.26 TRINITY_DN5099_c0_g1_i1:62-379(+)
MCIRDRVSTQSTWALNKRKIFDSADYFMEQEKNMKIEEISDQRIEDTMKNQHQKILENPHKIQKRNPLLSKVSKIRFDSADYFMEVYNQGTTNSCVRLQLSLIHI